MYRQGMLSKSKELMLLANLDIFNDVPYRATKVLEKGFKDEIVEKTERNYEIFARAYQESREWKDAIPPLTTAAKLSEDGDLYMQLCQSYLFDVKYAKAESACVKAINKGDLRSPGATWMLLGTARYNRDRKETALKAFKNAAKHKKTRKNANRWVKYLEQEAKNDAIRAARAKALADRAAREADEAEAREAEKEANR